MFDPLLLYRGSVSRREIYSVSLVRSERNIPFLKDMGEGKQHRWINKSFLNVPFNHPISFSVLIVPLL